MSGSRKERIRRTQHPYGETCYLCAEVIERGQRFSRDHVPPLQFFPSRLREEFCPQLDTVPVHARCNEATKLDEEYFRASVGPMAIHNPIGAALCEDLKRAYQDPRRRRLGEMVLREFGTITLPGNLTYKRYDHARVSKVLWKIVRGLIFVESERTLILPPDWPHEVRLYPTPEEVKLTLEPEGWFPALRDTHPMGRYGRVFEYKSVGVLSDGTDPWSTAQAWGMLIWDQVICAVFFHNVGCPCDACEASSQ